MAQNERSFIKPKRNYRDVLNSLAQVLKIKRDLEEPIWREGGAEHDSWGAWPLRLTIWNIFKGSGGEHFYNDFRLLAFQSDVVLLQEALLSRRSMQYLVPPGFGGVHGASYERADALRDGVMTIARIQPLHAPERYLCKYPEPLLKTLKAALVTTYRLQGDGGPLMVVNLHATLFRSVRRAEEELDHLIQQLPQHRGPLIFAGDFNTFTPAYLRAVQKRLEALGLRHVPVPNDPRRALDHLDQLFVRGLEVVQIQVDTRVQSSDHFPIRATLRLPAPLAHD